MDRDLHFQTSHGGIRWFPRSRALSQPKLTVHDIDNADVTVTITLTKEQP